MPKFHVDFILLTSRLVEAKDEDEAYEIATEMVDSLLHTHKELEIEIEETNITPFIETSANEDEN